MKISRLLSSWQDRRWTADEFGLLLRRGLTDLGRATDALMRHPYLPIVLIILISTVVNFFLVFQFSDYRNYLTSDMHGYWQRAMQIFNGDEMNPNTWVSNAPFYPRVMAEVFTWLNYFGLNDYFLEAILSLNILLSCLGTLGLYIIGLHVFKNRKVSLLLAAFYAFSYPNLYFNTFVLGEPFAVPLIIFSIALLFHYKDSYKVFLSALVLAFAVGVRPSNGLLGLPFALYITFAGFAFRKPLKECVKALAPRVARAAVFSLVFFAFIFTIVAENYRISEGELRGMTAHSGYNFFLGQAQSHKIVSSYDGVTYGFVPSSVAGNPEYGTITTHIPIYKSDLFFDEGWKLLRANPQLWWDHFKKYKNLFFDNLFPAVPSVLGFETLFDPFRYIVFYMLVFSGLLYVAFREKDVARADILFFASIFLLCSASLYFFTVTHQYFLNFSYSVYVLFVMAAYSVVRNFSQHKNFIVGYIAVVALATVAYYAYQGTKSCFVEKKVAVTVHENVGPIHNFDSRRNITATEHFDVNNLNFVQSDSLEHGTLGEFEQFKDTFFVEARTEFEVLKEGVYMFTFYSDDGYRVLLDGERLMGHNGLKKMDQFGIRHREYLEKGRHTLEIDHFENYALAGLVGYYRRLEPDEEPVSPYEYDTRWGQGNLIGDDGEFTRFYYPDTADNGAGRP